MQSKPDSNSPLNEDVQNIDLSPKTELKSAGEVLWFNFPQAKLYSHCSSGRRGARLPETPAKRWGHSSWIFNKSMFVFGGRHSHRSLVNIYTFDFSTFTWSKVDPAGQTPPARDSHSAILVNIEFKAFI